VIEQRGDEVLAVFADEGQAVRAAIELQATLAEEMAADSSLPLTVGVGIDAGEAVPVGEGYRGASLNMAARLCAPGRCVSPRACATLPAASSSASFSRAAMPT